MSLAQSERAELAATLRTVGPDAPTMCGDWDARDLAAHLVIRERRPDAALGIVFSNDAGTTEKVSGVPMMATPCADRFGADTQVRRM